MADNIAPFSLHRALNTLRLFTVPSKYSAEANSLRWQIQEFPSAPPDVILSCGSTVSIWSMSLLASGEMESHSGKEYEYAPTLSQ